MRGRKGKCWDRHKRTALSAISPHVQFHPLPLLSIDVGLAFIHEDLLGFCICVHTSTYGEEGSRWFAACVSLSFKTSLPLCFSSSVFLSVGLPFYLSVWLSVCLGVCLSVSRPIVMRKVDWALRLLRVSLSLKESLSVSLSLPPSPSRTWYRVIESEWCWIVPPALVAAHPVASVEEDRRSRHRRRNVETKRAAPSANVLVPRPREQLRQELKI